MNLTRYSPPPTPSAAVPPTRLSRPARPPPILSPPPGPIDRGQRRRRGRRQPVPILIDDDEMSTKTRRSPIGGRGAPAAAAVLRGEYRVSELSAGFERKSRLEREQQLQRYRSPASSYFSPIGLSDGRRSRLMITRILLSTSLFNGTLHRTAHYFHVGLLILRPSVIQTSPSRPMCGS